MLRVPLQLRRHRVCDVRLGDAEVVHAHQALRHELFELVGCPHLGETCAVAANEDESSQPTAMRREEAWLERFDSTRCLLLPEITEKRPEHLDSIGLTADHGQSPADEQRGIRW